MNLKQSLNITQFIHAVSYPENKDELLTRKDVFNKLKNMNNGVVIDESGTVYCKKETIKNCYNDDLIMHTKYHQSGLQAFGLAAKLGFNVPSRYSGFTQVTSSQGTFSDTKNLELYTFTEKMDGIPVKDFLLGCAADPLFYKLVEKTYLHESFKRRFWLMDADGKADNILVSGNSKNTLVFNNIDMDRAFSPLDKEIELYFDDLGPETNWQDMLNILKQTKEKMLLVQDIMPQSHLTSVEILYDQAEEYFSKRNNQTKNNSLVIV